MFSIAKDQFIKSLSEKSRDELITTVLRLFDEGRRISCRLKEYENAGTEMSLQFKQMKEELAGVKEENRMLKEQNLHLTGVRDSQAHDLFGRKSETAASIREGADPEKNVDPLAEDAPEEETKMQGPKTSTPAKTSGPRKKRDTNKARQRAEQKRKALENLPHQKVFDFDTEELNKTYGSGCWRIAFWRKHESYHRLPSTTYVRETYTPVIVDRYGDICGADLYEGAVLPKRKASAELLAELMTDKYKMFLPVYRLEHDENRYGIPLSRQTMTNWMNQAALDLLKPVYDLLCQKLKHYRYQQCDETTYIVIKDGRGPGSKCYIWAHRSSEHLNQPPIIIYSFEKTRGGDHLLDFFRGLEKEIFLSSDAYSAYSSAEKKMGGLIHNCGCMMHSRRRYYYDALLNGKNATEEGELLPSEKVLQLIRSVYIADEALKDLSAEERTKERQSKVAPLVDELFDYIKTIDTESPGCSDKLKDAKSYALNHEQQLRMFLTDGNIPIDNGACERDIKDVALLRKNSLFSFSINGALASMITLSLIVTAKANNSDPFYYLKYVLERMSKKYYYNHQEIDLEDLLPWAPAYRQYEEEEKQRVVNAYAPPSDALPLDLMKTSRLYVA